MLFEIGSAPTLVLNGADVFPFLQRLSTNDVESLHSREYCTTIFLNAQGRILERVIVQRLRDEAHVQLQTGRDDLLLGYLRRNIFFQDDVSIKKGGERLQFELVMPRAKEAFSPLIQPDWGIHFICHDPEREDACTFSCNAHAEKEILAALRSVDPDTHIETVEGYDLRRIQLGRPAVTLELTPEFLPLELGLWEEISFKKGCYVGQEIIARMESRQQLARLLVYLTTSDEVSPGAKLSFNGKQAGKITSVAQDSESKWHALAIVKRDFARKSRKLTIAETETEAEIQAFAGRQPAWVSSKFNCE